MRIAEAHVYAFSLPLVRPFDLPNGRLTHRDGLLLELVGDNEWCVVGEASPLPGYSKETLAEAQASLCQAAHKLTGMEPNGIEHTTLFDREAFSSVSFAVESALLYLSMVQKERQSTTRPGPLTLPVNALLAGDLSSIIDQATSCVAQGYRSVKVKVGRRDLDEDIELVRRLSDMVSGIATLRLDANRAWSLKQAYTFFKGIADRQIEYIEEPCASLHDSLRLAESEGLPLALDESLVEIDHARLESYKGVVALVIKPTLVGGVGRAIELAEFARQLDMKAVISSSFESSAGVYALGNLALQIDQTTPAGLDTVSHFKADTTITPLRSVSGRLHLPPPMTIACQLNRSLLTEVTDA